MSQSSSLDLSLKAYEVSYYIDTCLLMPILNAENSVVESSAQLGTYVEVNGEVEFVEVESVKPGDEVVCQSRYKNTSDAAVTDLSPYIEVPQGTTLQLEDISPVPSFVSIAGELEAWPLSAERAEEVKPADIEGLKWDIKTLAPEQVVSINFGLTVNAQ